MVCSSGVGFDPVVEGETLRFELSGLYNAVMVMSDDKTDTVWAHLTGDGLFGKHKGKTLKYLPTYSVTWKEWRERHPDTTVLAFDERNKHFYSPPGLGRKGLGPGKSSDGKTLTKMFRKTVDGPMDRRMEPNAVVLGVTAGEASKAYPLGRLGAMTQDELGGVPVLILTGGEGAMAFDRRLDGKALSFEEAGGKVRDVATKSLWNPEGRCTEGELKGKSLTPVFAIVTEWYGWSLYRPKTAVLE